MSAARAFALFEDDVLAGLRAPVKRLPSRLLYDERGTQLFDRICQLDTHYLTRTELVLLRTHLPAIAEHVGRTARVIEPGANHALRAHLLLHGLDAPAVYVPIEMSAEQLASTVAIVHREVPGVEILPVHGDYQLGLRVPDARSEYARTLVFYPGSAIGGFEPDEAIDFLARLGTIAGPNGSLLLGTDSTHDVNLLLRAYDDDNGVMAELDRNVLVHVNRIERATFDPESFLHRAVWDPVKRRVEMHLVSRRDHIVHVDGWAVRFARGEPIITEHAYKHDVETLASMLGHAGWSVRRVFTDDVFQVRLWLCDRDHRGA